MVWLGFWPSSRPDNGLVGPLLEHFGHQLAEVLLPVLELLRVEGEVGVPGGADDAGLLHHILAKEFWGPVADDILQPQVPPLASRQQEDGGQGGGQGDEAQGLFAALAAHQGRDVEGLVVQMGSRWRCPTIWGERMGSTAERK